MNSKCGYPASRFNTLEQRRNLLKHYLMLLRDYGDVARHLPKGFLYRQAGERTFYTEKTAGKYIREMLNDDDAVREAMEMLNEELA